MGGLDAVELKGFLSKSLNSNKTLKISGEILSVLNKTFGITISKTVVSDKILRVSDKILRVSDNELGMC